MAASPLIVSLWRGKDKQDLLCSGLLLTGRHILTVRHAFQDWPDQAPVHVRLIDGVDGDVTARVLQCHRERDAAILQLDTAVGPIVSPDLLVRSDRSYDGEPATLRVIDPQSHGRSSPSNYCVANFDHGTGEYVLAPQDARGHSGGVVEVAGCVIGLLSRRRKEDPLCRAVAMHLLRFWIEEVIGPLPGQPAPLAPRPTGARSAAYRALVERVRRRVRDCLEQQRTADLARVWGADPLAGFDPGLPAEQVAEQLQGLLDGLRLATETCIRGWKHLSDVQLGDLKDDCRGILSELIKLTVDQDTSDADLGAVAAARPDRLHLACRFGGTGDVVFCALADIPHLLAKRAQSRDIMSDHAIHVDDLLPSGQGQWERQDLLKKLWIEVMGDALPGRIEGKDYELLLARLKRRRRTHRPYVLAAPGQRDWCLKSEYRQWADELHLGLVLHEEGQCPHLLLDEPDLIDTVRDYLELLETL